MILVVGRRRLWSVSLKAGHRICQHLHLLAHHMELTGTAIVNVAGRSRRLRVNTRLRRHAMHPPRARVATTLGWILSRSLLAASTGLRSRATGRHRTLPMWTGTAPRRTTRCQGAAHAVPNFLMDPRAPILPPRGLHAPLCRSLLRKLRAAVALKRRASRSPRKRRSARHRPNVEPARAVPFPRIVKCRLRSRAFHRDRSLSRTRRSRLR